MNKVTNFLQSPFMKRFGLGCLALLVGFAFFIAGAIKTSKQPATPSSIVGEQQETNDDSGVPTVMDNRAQTAADIQAVSEIDLGRKESDDRVAAKMFRYATTWNSAESYDTARSMLLHEFPYIEESCELLEYFFPPLNVIQTTDASGQLVYDPFTTGMNLSFVSMNTQVFDVDGDIYTYFAEIVVQSKGPAGGTASASVFALYKTDKNGQILEPRLYMAAA